MAGSRPIIALAMGDPAGISPELAAKLLSQADIRSAARIVVFGDLRVLDRGAAVAGVSLDIETVSAEDQIPTDPTRPILVDLKNLDPGDVTIGAATLPGGRFATENFRRALQFAAAGRAQGVVFTPFNKKAMRMAYAGYDDEIRFIADVLKFDGPAREFNVLDELWNARVTSHIPLSEVASSITPEAILRNLALADACMRAAGFERPRIAVAGLNPHAGDGGNFGREEIDVIEPAVQQGIERGFAVAGPFPADTVFVRAKRGDFDAVLTMYHDQGQIAMKLMGFDRGVTLVGGFPFPICTPAHGTAYDIVGRGIANIGAARQAVLLAVRMASQPHLDDARDPTHA
ncbi:MAG: 4-hydroxythreonine-4-phosphate dehydrogenase PdxA [Rhodoplanes sp.]|uniref:4-hydroxythreonine-4-phosphate dehydrogenase PdxA n=1 Tax=Rhodoplanes sp. TaxID=1968906 RepID=UPI0018589600|nr:4-hydroxythreonine-4-phosphate dehydrogenase PdxA [Rhodoplanes sp.]NVO16295.1 4-hydroxythreonine-4-phosphate dehydrogenase PdxA [Rhodoplanes sp.]